MADGHDRQQRRHGGGRAVIDLAGQRFGALQVIERTAHPTAVLPDASAAAAPSGLTVARR
jgi:hypothetical protein